MTSCIRRRAFIMLLGGAAIAPSLLWPFAARAQQAGKVWRIGFLSGTSREAISGLYDAFVQGMRELGYVEGKDYIIEWRSAEGKYEQIPDIAAEFARLKVDVIVTALSAALPTLKQSITTIPIVMAASADPVGTGLVASLVHPGGNITGLAGSSDDSSPKQLELLASIVPNVSRIGFLGNPNGTVYSPVLKGAQDAARKAGLSLVPIDARNPQEIENAFIAFTRERVPAVMMAGDAVFFGQRWRIAELALAHRIATMAPQREYAAAGGLMSYGENLADFLRRSASYVDKIFKGAKPGDLPIEQPTRFNLVINRKTADALGVTIPAQLYIFADEVIE
jgi:putative tryptophan/tyrosine transport system substrate-binding protein